jgi:hypothetical protein
MSWLNARKSRVHIAMVARLFLASTLLLNASALVFQTGFGTKLIFLTELSLGVVIAIGWETRYAAGLVLLGTVAASLSFIPLRIVSAGSQSIPLALVTASALLICFGRNNAFRDSISIEQTATRPKCRSDHFPQRTSRSHSSLNNNQQKIHP